ALAVAIGSLGIYLAAFFFPEIGRKNDIYWSGVGLFYALVLWVCAKQITGGLLLGQVAGVVLLGWYAFQTLQLRRQLTPQQQQTAVPSAAQVKSNVQEQVTKISPLQKLSQLGKKATSKATAAKEQLKPKSEVKEVPTPLVESTPTVEIVDNRTPVAPETTESASTFEEKIASEVEVIPPAESNIVDPEAQPSPEIVAATPVETTQLEESTTTETETESSSEDEISKLHRPDPPSPELVEAAIEDAEEKHQPASPPETDEKS
ncbi:MAG: Ycf66 family protein, partial [Chroococcidiopsis sp.]